MELHTPRAAPEAAVLSVAQLHQAMLAALGAAGLDRVWVRGVVSGLRRGPRFVSWELVDYGDDATDVRAVLPVGAFRRPAAEIDAALAAAGLELVDGLEVAVWGALDPNPAFGRLRLLAEGVDPRASVGAAVLARDAAVARLQASGELYAQQRLPVPDVVRQVGLVSSAAAAGRADVLAVLERSPAPVHLVEAAAAMAGPQAPAEVAGALRLLAGAGVDVIVVARGGGARSDLAAWDSIDLARAIAACPVPVWVALGHATDRTLADLAAQRSHPTPSAAAAAVVAGAERVAQHQAARQAADAAHHVELAAARRRLRLAVAAAVVILLLVLVLAAGR
ncbi:MAG TPA: exodeoxyribonuclease VII large subunit [Acidimicrobiales bacterium]|nr:exodeoxyribonuclease VII large subunit [Acidimicrobiales bacterium]